MDYYIYTLRRISFNKTLYKKQITEQRKDTAQAKLTTRWESDGGMKKIWKPSIERSSKDWDFGLRKGGGVSEMSSR